MDLLAMVVIYWLYNREVVQWPEHDGRPSIKLEHLNNLNQLAEGQAHDALVDVRATVELARRLRTAPKVWDYLAGYFDKRTDLNRMAALPVPLNPQPVLTPWVWWRPAPWVSSRTSRLRSLAWVLPTLTKTRPSGCGWTCPN